MRKKFLCLLILSICLISGCTGGDSFRNGNAIPSSEIQSPNGNGKGFGGILSPIIDNVIFPRGSDLIAGDLIQIIGSHFVEGATVTVGGVACSPVTFVTSNQLTCILVAGIPGAPGVVIVTNPGGLQAKFTQTALPNTPITPGPVVTFAKVLGQTALNNIQQAGAGGFANPRHAIVSGGKLWVADALNNRIAVWNSVPTTSGTAPNFVLGQANLNAVSGNFGGASEKTLFAPSHIASDGVSLVVADTFNHRVLIWSTLPTASDTPANIVLGQQNMSDHVRQNGSASVMNSPRGVFYNGRRLFVADTFNHRVLIWNSLPTTNGQAADVVLGQANMTTFSANAGGGTSVYPKPALWHLV